jgi:hypothetical protein
VERGTREADLAVEAGREERRILPDLRGGSDRASAAAARAAGEGAGRGTSARGVAAGRERERERGREREVRRCDGVAECDGEVETDGRQWTPGQEEGAGGRGSTEDWSGCGPGRSAAVGRRNVCLFGVSKYWAELDFRFVVFGLPMECREKSGRKVRLRILNYKTE